MRASIGSVLVASASCALAAAPARSPAGCDLASSHAPREVACQRAWIDTNVRLNDVLVIGTHNSYKQAIPAQEMAALARKAPEAAPTLDYAHRSLTEQLDAGARQIEIDPYYDPDGGRYADPRGPRTAGADLGKSWRRQMAAPGFKVFHVVDVDVRSSCPTLRRCLDEVRRWSDRHPDHVPIVILVNGKDELEVRDGVAPLPFDATAFDALDREIRAALPASKLITPDDVQGRFPTLRDAATGGGWPTLGKARGKLLLTLEMPADKVRLYRGARRSLEGRAMFVNAEDEASPAAAYITLNDPVADAARIRAAVAAGLLVRTRADADTVEARTGSTSRRDAALRGGAQLVSTDYLWADPRFAGGYRVTLPAAAICNPVRMRDRCGGAVAEEKHPHRARETYPKKRG